MDEKELIGAVKLHLIGDGKWVEKQKKAHLEILRKKGKEESFLFKLQEIIGFLIFSKTVISLSIFYPLTKMFNWEILENIRGIWELLIIYSFFFFPCKANVLN